MAGKTIKMRLFETPFNLIKAGKKKVEFRLYDEKRQRLNIGDIILFEKLPDKEESIKVKIKDIRVYQSFGAVFEKEKDSIQKYSNRTKVDFQKGFNQYFSNERLKKYPPLVIEFKLI